MSRFSPSDAALEGFRLSRTHPGMLLAWSAVYFGGLLLIFLVMTATLGPEFIAVARKDGFFSGDLDDISELLAHSLPAFLLVLGLSALLWSIMTAGVLRLVLRPSEHGFAHLKVGRDELRLTLANLLCVGIYVATAIVGIVLYQAARQSGPIATAVVVLGALAFVFWVGVRLSLLLPTVFQTGKISLADAWGRTKGHYWPLLGMLLLAAICYVMVWVVFAVISVILVAVSGGGDALQDMTHLNVVTALSAVLTLIMQFLLQVLQIVMIYAPTAVAYREITGEADPEAF
ncbi:MAG: hypothetical protein GC203_02025 [Phenylobacterium sp.]|uniref:hypothetical protein n=1 Tax=Phenylobacterium sp. TaxID=1871053 RepID=UPI0025D893C4|nr:hypothetical protein [Phenylobacterium sp.]MBI1196622.1 hypothetical protein [Phenylobacterium sp.]